jgi:hypothetical protein
VHNNIASGLPSIVPKNPLQLVSCIMTSKVDPLSTRRSALTSAIAISIADLADLPIVELNVNKAPIFTVLGCAMDDVRSVPRRERRKRGEKTKPISQKVKKKRTKTELFSVRKAILESSWNLMVHLD